jgi:hypothetical protein
MVGLRCPGRSEATGSIGERLRAAENRRNARGVDAIRVMVVGLQGSSALVEPSPGPRREFRCLKFQTCYVSNLRQLDLLTCWSIYCHLSVPENELVSGPNRVGATLDYCRQ